MLQPVLNQTVLLESVFKKRFEKNYEYMMSLRTDNLLRNYLFEAGLWSYSGNSSTTIDPEEVVEDSSNWHWGWESIGCEIRGHFLGHWLSGAAQIYATTKDVVILAKIQDIINGLETCQKANGAGWVASIPEKYMEKMTKGQTVWAPHYTIHKTMMGLYDVYLYTDNRQALEVLISFSKWFINWCHAVDDETFQVILSYETGGMIEIWAQLYHETANKDYLELIEKYYRKTLFDGLLAGEDVLTNKHANTQIAEVLGIAKVWEVTGNPKYRQIVELFWEQAVEERGTYVTGGVSCGELWTPKGDLSQRLGKGQEHCTVYHMIRLAQYLYKWTGHKKYADYEELCIYNGILAQQNRNTGMVSYFLDFAPGATKQWGDPLKHFWCCHGTLVQAQSSYWRSIFYQKESELVVSQYIPAQTHIMINDGEFKITLKQDSQKGSGPLERSNATGKKAIQNYQGEVSGSRPKQYVFQLSLQGPTAKRFTVNLRKPDWAMSIKLTIDGERVLPKEENGYLVIERDWHNSEIEIVFLKEVVAIPLLGATNIVAFKDGPLVLAGLTESDCLLHVPKEAGNLLQPSNERHHSFWRDGTYRTVGQEHNIEFVPLADITNEPYCVYFPTTLE